MRRLRALFIRLASFFRTDRRDKDLAAEMESHLQLHAEDNQRAGMNAQEARRQALIKLGGVEQTKESYRRQRGLPLLESWLRDFRYAARVLRKNIGFTFVVVFTLALGIGANTAIFSVLESQLWRPLPFPDSERLVDAHVVLRENPHRWDALPARVYEAWRRQSHSFKNLVATGYPEPRNLTISGFSERLLAMQVGSSLFDTLEVPPERGRAFLPEETIGQHRVVILSHALWQSHFSSDPSVVGKLIAIDGDSYVVVGVASPLLRFEYLEEPLLYLPLSLDLAAPVFRNTYVIGRLAPGATPESARAELDGILQRELQSQGIKQEDVAAVTNLRETWTQFAAHSLYFFAGAVLLVLLIACVNNAGLLLARGLARQREFALRATLGAARAALIRQLLAESLLLSLAGGAAGTLIGFWGARAFSVFIPENFLPRSTETSLDARVLFFVLAVSIFSAVLMGIVPALFSSRVDVADSLRKGAGGLSASRTQHKTRGILVAVEVCLALVLLFGAGLFLSSFVRLEQAPRGFDAPGALTFRVSLRGKNYAQPDQQQRYFRTLSDQLGSLPGVQAVTSGSGIPLEGSLLTASVNVAGRPPRGKHGYGVYAYAVVPNFFDVFHMHLLAGRAFLPHDTETSPRVAILSRNAARTLFGSEDPLGKVLEFVPDELRGLPAEAPVQIVGVAENAQVFGANEVPFDVIYFPFSQHPVSAANLVISSRLPRGALLGAIRDAAYSLDKDQPIFAVQTMDDLIGSSLGGARFNLILVACLAVVALALVSVGIFATVAYFVQQRTQEFGIRLALGATPAQILRHAISRASVMGVAGLLLGVAASLALGRVLRGVLYLVPGERAGILYGVNIYDPVSMSLACALLLSVLLLASFVPARRAMRVDPMVALRYE